MQNGSNETWPEGDLFTWKGAKLIIITSVMFMGIIGNSMVMYIYTFRLPGHTVTLIKRMLAGLDLTSLLIAQPLLLYLIVHPKTPIFTLICVVASFVGLTTTISANCVLVMITADRFMRLCLMSRDGVGERLAKRLFFGIVIACALFNITAAWIFGKNIQHHDYYHIQLTQCFIKKEAIKTTIFFVFFGWHSLLFLLSLTTMLILYAKIIKALARHAELQRQLAESCSMREAGSLNHTQIQAAHFAMKTSVIVFIVITILFFVLNSVYLCAALVILLRGNLNDFDTPYLQAALDVGLYAPLLSSMINPIIYSFTSSAFRKRVYIMIWGTLRRSSGSSTVVSTVTTSVLY